MDAELPPDVIDAKEFLFDYFQSHDDVAYAEIGGVSRQQTHIAVRGTRLSECVENDKTGVWCRVFADGSAGYRFITDFDTDSLQDTAERVVLSGKHLGQNIDSRYDDTTIHQAVHDGWHDGRSISDIDLETKRQEIESSLEESVSDLDRYRLYYDDEAADVVLSTTTGSTVRTRLDRVSVETIGVRDGVKIREHHGSTGGTGLLDDITELNREFVSEVEQVSSSPETPPADGERTVVLGPQAAGRLFHVLSHYFEMDMVYLGSSPFTAGDRIGPDGLTIEDTVHPGSWGARAYDAEARPTQPLTIVSDGVVRNFLHSTTTAAMSDSFPSGNVIPSLGSERPPRIHARHLDVAPGPDTEAELRDGADLYVERLGPATYQNEATSAKRTSTMPPTAMYAKNIDDQTPDEYSDESSSQRISFPITVGQNIGISESRVTSGTIEISLSELDQIEAFGNRRESFTDTCTKHRSQFPIEVCSPAIKVRCRVKS